MPLWVRALLAADHLASRAQIAREALRDELLLAFIRPEDRAALTTALYARQSTYLPGGQRFEGGLFAWEKRVLELPFFPRSGRILLGAAGAGRELVALVERGFEVVAFDPCAPFADAARSVIDPAKATVVHASYADLVDVAHGRPGPLAFLREEPGFDAVILGWGSLSHVTPSSERLELLRALATIAPRAPVLASFALDAEHPIPPASKGRMRDTLRRLFTQLNAPGLSEGSDYFSPHGGFFSNLHSGELTTLARGAGYEVALFNDAPYPHAVFVPLGGHVTLDQGPPPDTLPAGQEEKHPSMNVGPSANNET